MASSGRLGSVLLMSVRSLVRSASSAQVAQIRPNQQSEPCLQPGLASNTETSTCATTSVIPSSASSARSSYKMRPVHELFTESKDLVYKERSIKVHVCENLYKDWKHSKPGWEHVSLNGFDLEIPFIHTGLDRSRSAGSAPTVVALHGAPGTHRDFEKLIPALDRAGANVVVPTFPDLHFTMKTQNYWHSLEEKLDVLERYLEALYIEEVDVLVCHSSSMYPAMQLALNSNIKVNSIVYFAPSGCRQITVLSPLPLFYWFNRNLRKPWAQKPMIWFAVAIIAAYGKPSTDTVGTVNSMLAMVQSRYDDAGSWCSELSKRGTPSLMLYGKRDKLIDVAISEEMAALLGNPLKETFYRYSGKNDNEAKMIAQGVSSYDFPEVVCFESGSHFAFKKFPDTYNYHVANFLRRHILEGFKN